MLSDVSVQLVTVQLVSVANALQVTVQLGILKLNLLKHAAMANPPIVQVAHHSKRKMAHHAALHLVMVRLVTGLQEMGQAVMAQQSHSVKRLKVGKLQQLANHINVAAHNIVLFNFIYLYSSS